MPTTYREKQRAKSLGGYTPNVNLDCSDGGNMGRGEDRDALFHTFIIFETVHNE